MHIAVIIPTYNAASYLPDAMASVVVQVHRDWSMVVVDDGSTDATADVAAGFTDPRISFIRQTNAGVSAARNRGLNAVTADAILFLDADDWLAPDALMRLATALDSRPGSIAVSGRPARVAPARVTPARVARDRSIYPMRPPPGGDLLECLLVRNLFVNGGHLLIRSRAIRTAGGFREDLSYGEDWEYWTRLAAQGPFAALPGHKAPVLFVRETPGSAYLRMATDPACFATSLDAIYASAAVLRRFPPAD